MDDRYRHSPFFKMDAKVLILIGALIAIVGVLVALKMTGKLQCPCKCCQLCPRKCKRSDEHDEAAAPTECQECKDGACPVTAKKID